MLTAIGMIAALKRSCFGEKGTVKRIYLSVSDRGKQTPFLQEEHCLHSPAVICQMGWMGRTSLPCSSLPSLVGLSPAGSAALLAGDALLLVAMIP